MQSPSNNSVIIHSKYIELSQQKMILNSVVSGYEEMFILAEKFK